MDTVVSPVELQGLWFSPAAKGDCIYRVSIGKTAYGLFIRPSESLENQIKFGNLPFHSLST